MTGLWNSRGEDDDIVRPLSIFALLFTLYTQKSRRQRLQIPPLKVFDSTASREEGKVLTPNCSSDASVHFSPTIPSLVRRGVKESLVLDRAKTANKMAIRPFVPPWSVRASAHRRFLRLASALLMAFALAPKWGFTLRAKRRCGVANTREINHALNGAAKWPHSLSVHA